MQREIMCNDIYRYSNHDSYHTYNNYNENRRVRSAAHSKRRARRRKKAAMLFMRNLILVAIILLIILGGFRMQAQAAEPLVPAVHHGPLKANSTVNDTERIYISLQIQPGDTIWDISKQYCGSRDSKSIKAYAKDIQEMNNISNARSLRSGSFIIVYQDVPTT